MGQLVPTRVTEGAERKHLCTILGSSMRTMFFPPNQSMTKYQGKAENLGQQPGATPRFLFLDTHTFMLEKWDCWQVLAFVIMALIWKLFKHFQRGLDGNFFLSPG